MADGFLEEVRTALSPGGLLDVEDLGGTEGVLDIAQGLTGAGFEVAKGFSLSKSLGSEARVLQQNAADVRRAGQQAVAEAERQGRYIIGAQRAQRGFQGVTMSGSSLDVLSQTAADAARNVQFVKYDFDSRVAALQFQAELARFNASQAKLGAIAGAVGTAARGFLSAASLASVPAPAMPFTIPLGPNPAGIA